MKSTKIYQVISTLSNEEKKAFSKFLASPYFNTTKTMSVLADLLYDLTGSDRDMQKEEVWEVLVEHKDYDNVRFRKYCSDLLKLVERFLAQEEFEANSLRSAAYLMKVVSIKGLEPLYNSSLRTARRLTKTQTSRGIDYLHDLYLIERYHQSIITAQDRTEKLNVELISDNLDKFYLAQKLLLYQLAMSQLRIVDREYNFLFLEEIFEHIKHNKYPETPQIRMLELVAQIYRTNDFSFFPELKSLLFEHIHLFPPDEANSIFRSALNFLIGWLNEGKPNMLSELFQMYQYALKQEFFFMEEGFNPWIFLSIVIVSLRLEEYEWCENFIEEYAQYLDEEHRENAVRFNTARLKLYQKKYREVISLLSQVEFEDYSYNLGAKAMLLATYYQLDEIDLLYSFLDSFSIFLRRNTKNIPQKRRENYLNLISYTKRLSRIGSRDKEKLNALRKEVEEKSNLGDKRWILEKIDEKLN